MVLSAALLAGLASAAQAQSDAPPATPQQPAAPTPSAQMDDNKALVRQAFARADANNDGKLSQEEAARLPAVAAKFTELDTDKDGFISSDEFQAGVRVGSSPAN
jgi:Ca2+-binding EF-hand superfamily protein